VESQSPIRPFVLKTSLAAAAAAWAAVFFVAMRPTPSDPNGHWIGVLIAIVGWPVMYGASLGMAWGSGWLVLNTRESDLYGPCKNSQLKLMCGLGLRWINAVIVIFPSMVLLLALLGLIGLIKS
jgi:hypothetical protein